MQVNVQLQDHTPRKIAAGNYSLNGPQNRSDCFEKRKIYYPLRELNYESSDVEGVAYSLYRPIILSSYYILVHTDGKLNWAKFLLKSLRTQKGNLTFMESCIARCVFYITNGMQLIQHSLLLSALYMFRGVFPPIIRSL